jgi:hypothetical protein
VESFFDRERLKSLEMDKKETKAMRWNNAKIVKTVFL